MSSVVKIHGHNFSIDTADWTNPADAELCEERIIKALNKLGKNRIAAAHSVYMFAAQFDEAMDSLQNGGCELWAPIDDAAKEAAWSILKTYSKEFHNTFSGHNHFVSAFKNPTGLKS